LNQPKKLDKKYNILLYDSLHYVLPFLTNYQIDFRHLRLKKNKGG